MHQESGGCTSWIACSSLIPSWRCCAEELSVHIWEDLCSPWPGKQAHTGRTLASVLFGSPSALPSHPAQLPGSCLSYLLWKGVFCRLIQSPKSLTSTNFPTSKSLRSCKSGTLSHLLVVKTITWLRAHKQRINNGPGLCYLLVHM